MEFDYTAQLRSFSQLAALAVSLSAVVMYATELIKKSVTVKNTAVFTLICFLLSMAFGVCWSLSFTELGIDYAVWLGFLVFLGASGFYKTLEGSDSWLGRTVKSYAERINGAALGADVENIDGTASDGEESGELTAAALGDDTSENESKAASGLEAGYISKNFKLSEFACRCGGEGCDGFNYLGAAPLDTALTAVLQRARDHYGLPVIVTSGIRCDKRNAQVGGVNGSRHTKGKAADCYIGAKAGVKDSELCEWFKQQPEVRYSYTGFGAVHVDVK